MAQSISEEREDEKNSELSTSARLFKQITRKSQSLALSIDKLLIDADKFHCSLGKSWSVFEISEL